MISKIVSEIKSDDFESDLKRKPISEVDERMCSICKKFFIGKFNLRNQKEPS